VTPPTPRLLSGPPRWGILCALVALMAFASGGAGLAHHVLAHSGVGPAHAGHVHAHGATPCGSTPTQSPSEAPAEAPADDETSHDCQVCTLLSAGFTPPAAPDAAPALRPANFQPFAADRAAPSTAPAPLPPARGPPSKSV